MLSKSTKIADYSPALPITRTYHNILNTPSMAAGSTKSSLPTPHFRLNNTSCGMLPCDPNVYTDIVL